MSEVKEGFRKIGVHVLMILGVLFALLFIFFKVYLPNYTNHGETVTVPDLEGFHYNDLERYLNDRGLTLRVTPDSGFMADVPPFRYLSRIRSPVPK